MRASRLAPALTTLAAGLPLAAWLSLVGCSPASGPSADDAAGAGAATPRAPATAPEARSPRNASYSIDVTLDPSRHRLTGREVITWRNITDTPAAELHLHLYYNAWKHARTTWLRERALSGRGADLDRRAAADWGYCQITSVRLLGGDASASATPHVDLTAEVRPIAPDDGNPFDETLVSVALPAPVAPGATTLVEVEWTSQVPRTFARTGRVGDFYFLAHWFPKVGVFSSSGWQTRQFHAGTEFFADYGVYDVRLRVPTGWVVGASGLEQGRQAHDDGTTTHTYRAHDVHDFAWTTSPDYLERQARFERPGLPPVEMRLLLQPEHAAQADRHFEATRAALRFYGEWYGPYPYPAVTIVDPAWQSGAGGMEYPTLFTAGTRWLAPRLVAEPEGVTVHEAGHQFWYGVVGNNEVEDAWMDEGINTFSEARATAEAGFLNFYSERYFGGFVPWVFHDIPLARATDGNLLSWYRTGAESDAPATPTFRYHPATGGIISYAKTALWLHSLERHLGWPMLQQALAAHYRRSMFRHPTPQEFFQTLDEVTGRDLTWFFDEVHRGSNTFDYAIDSLDTSPVGFRGFRGSGPQPAFVDEPAPEGRHETRVVVRRLGEARFPVDLLVSFADGTTRRERWDGRERWKLFVMEGPSPAVSAIVDPDRVLLLDVDYTNNSRSVEPEAAAAATKGALFWATWLQDLVLTWMFFA